MANLTCPKCGKKFNSDNLTVYRCKDCRAWLDYDKQEVASPQVIEQEPHDPLLGLDPATREIVLASNRTTYAVRSLALYLFITITTAFAGLVLINLGRPESIFFGTAIIIIGFIWSMVAGITELNKSKP
jgi:hypothetical protein